MCFQGGACPRARVGVAAMLLILPGLFQLVPLPRGLLTSLASANVAFQDNFRLGAALAQDLSLHPISADPALTWLTFGFLFVGTVWVGGLSRSLHSHVEPRDIASWTVKIAVCVAVLALAQKATFNGKIYWFWESRFRESFNYFGPFVNRNHFAGWMLLALSLSAGYLAGQFSSAARRVKPGFREHLLWLGTPQASAILMTSVSLLVMAVSLVWTMSRSGIAAHECRRRSPVGGAHRTSNKALFHEEALRAPLSCSRWAERWPGRASIAWAHGTGIPPPWNGD